MFSNTVFSIAFLMVVIGVGNYLSLKTKGVFGSVLLMSIVFIAGYQIGLIPKDVPGNTGIVAVAGSFSTMMIITNLGTMINLRRLIAEYKTVITAIIALAFMSFGFILVGVVFFDLNYAICAIPPIAGAIVAAQMIAEAAANAGMPTLGGFATLLCSLQTFVAIPVAAICLRKYALKAANGLDAVDSSNEAFKAEAESKKTGSKLIKGWPEGLSNPDLMAGKVALVAFLGVILGGVTGIPAAVLVLVMGVLFTELGFLEESTLQKAGYFNFCMLALLASLLPSFASLSITDIINMIVPLLVFLLAGAFFLAIGGGLVGKLVFKLDFMLSAALGLCAMFGFPFTMTITNDVISSMGLDEARRKKLEDMIMPKMIISGFVSVTICSVLIAGILAPMLG